VAAVRDPGEFAARKGALAADFESAMDSAAARFAAATPFELIATWRTGRAAVISALASVPAGERVRWVVAPLSPATVASTRLMELVGHGQDIRDAVGARWRPTDRIRHVAWLGLKTRDFAMANNGQAPPSGEFRVELISPSGAVWAWGPEGAAQRVSGPAADFCLLVTKWRHRADLALRAQAYAGPPSAGRRPGQFAKPG
jgi:enediyne biosynthesis protein E11